MKHKQYLTYLTQNDILELVDELGYKVCNKYGKEPGEFEAKYEKLYDESGGTYELFIKCIDKVSTKPEIDYKPLSGMFEFLEQTFLKRYNPDIKLLYISDFLVRELAVFDDDNKQDNQEVFAYFMLDKMKDISQALAKQYVKDYNSFIKNYNKNIEARRKAEQNSGQEM